MAKQLGGVDGSAATKKMWGPTPDPPVTDTSVGKSMTKKFPGGDDKGKDG
jgi:hypothetical protein